MQFEKRSVWQLLLSLLLALSVTSCATTPKPSPPVVVPEAAIPKLPSEMRKAPEPSGAYWSRVMRWRKDWQETLKTLQPKSGG